MSLVDKAKGLLGVGPVNVPEPAPAPEVKPLYIKEGGEGTSNVTARRLVAFVKLPDRRDVPLQDRYALLEADMREAMAIGARKVMEQAQHHHLGGFEWNAADIEYDVAPIASDVLPKKGDLTALKREVINTLVVSLRITRK